MSKAREPNSRVEFRRERLLEVAVGTDGRATVVARWDDLID